MLSTDLGARGLDIPHLDRVINYDFPLSTCDYLQRAGRTGRAVRMFIYRGNKDKQSLFTTRRTLT
jgi:superfamily II DNA/RNA helicase